MSARVQNIPESQSLGELGKRVKKRVKFRCFYLGLPWEQQFVAFLGGKGGNQCVHAGPWVPSCPAPSLRSPGPAEGHPTVCPTRHCSSQP